MEGWRAEQQRQQTNAWSPGQKILNDTGARMPEHTLFPPAPVTARIVWEDDGEEYLDTEAAGWSGQLVYVRVRDVSPGSVRGAAASAFAIFGICWTGSTSRGSPRRMAPTTRVHA